MNMDSQWIQSSFLLLLTSFDNLVIGRIIASICLLTSKWAQMSGELSWDFQWIQSCLYLSFVIDNLLYSSNWLYHNFAHSLLHHITVASLLRECSWISGNFFAWNHWKYFGHHLFKESIGDCYNQHWTQALLVQNIWHSLETAVACHGWIHCMLF